MADITRKIRGKFFRFDIFPNKIEEDIDGTIFIEILNCTYDIHNVAVFIMETFGYRCFEEEEKDSQEDGTYTSEQYFMKRQPTEENNQ